MADTPNFTDFSNQWFDLANDIYSTYIKSLVKGQERALELTKTLLDKADNAQADGKRLVEDYANQVQRAQQLLQSVIQGNIQSGTEILNQYRADANANLAEMNAKLEELQHRIETQLKGGKKE
jgi:polyhydroxyalkanoate synthesis regulator phasin